MIHTKGHLQTFVLFIVIMIVKNRILNGTLNDKTWYQYFHGQKLFTFIQAALVIRGFSIRGFDYSRTQKPQIRGKTVIFSLN